ncbi:MAG: DNA recombination protein RmuC [Alphaproteobacteria bacterium]|nr:DNA recombination protein RmuC [Alphaproteobacteria bacterium]
MDALPAALMQLPSAVIIGAGFVLLSLALLAAAGAGRRRMADRLDALERRVREDGDALRRALTELDQGLRREMAESAGRGFAGAFDKVQEGAREQGVVLQRFNLATQTSLTELRTDIADRLRAGFDRFAEQNRADQEQLRARVDQKLEAIRTGNEAKLDQMRAAVDEQLQAALEKRVGESFKQVAEQFAQVQQAIGQVQTVAGQVGDLKRLFSNVKARGVWGEAQLDAVLEDVLPHGYERNFRVREGSAEAVEFALRMPLKDRDEQVYLPVDSKFPTEDYDRLLLAAETADKEAEQAARRALERRIREEAQRISGKYISPPRTVDFAIMYLPTEGLFSEVNRVAGLVEFVRRDHRVMVIGPSLLPALLHTVRIGQLSMVLERRSGDIAAMLSAVKTEWSKLGKALDGMADRAEKLSKSIDDTRVRTRQVGKKLGGVLTIEPGHADRLLGFATEEKAALGEEVEDVD